MQEARRRPSRRRRRRATEYAYEARRTHRRRRSSRRVREQYATEARRHGRRRRHYSREARRDTGSYVAELAIAVLSGGVGFVLADAVDRFLATYDPAATEKPKDKFTSDGTGTLANTLNVAARPDWKRAAAAVAMTAAPALGSMAVDHPYVRSTLEGMAIGAGVNGFKLLWNNVVMPLLIGKDTSAPALQKSYIARLYPAEVAAHINMTQTPPQQAVSAGGGSGALSGTPQAGVGSPDVGPFALSGDSPYPTAEAALRKNAGVSGDSPYPTAEAALRKNAGVSGDSPYPTAEAALRQQAGVSQPPSYTPGPPSTPGPGPQVSDHHHGDGCGCGVGEAAGDAFLGFIGEPAEESDQASPLMG